MGNGYARRERQVTRVLCGLAVRASEVSCRDSPQCRIVWRCRLMEAGRASYSTAAGSVLRFPRLRAGLAELRLDGACVRD